MTSRKDSSNAHTSWDAPRMAEFRSRNGRHWTRRERGTVHDPDIADNRHGTSLVNGWRRGGFISRCRVEDHNPEETRMRNTFSIAAATVASALSLSVAASI